KGGSIKRYVFGFLSTRWFQRRPFRHPHYFRCGVIVLRKSVQKAWYLIPGTTYGSHSCTATLPTYPTSSTATLGHMFVVNVLFSVLGPIRTTSHTGCKSCKYRGSRSR
ncbi:unnamed protein product, partial [Pylaiella littoralis]